MKRRAPLLLLTIALSVPAVGQEPGEASPGSYYLRGMELWRAGEAGEGLRHLMTATRDPEVSYYAARQVSLMGRYALPLLYQGLWHQEEVIQRQSAIIIGWIGETESTEPLLFRLRYPDAPVEVEYALRKIGGVTGPQLLELLGGELSNSALVDHKVAALVRLARAFGLAVDPTALLSFLETMEAENAGELAEDPFGHLANARLGLSRFLAERKVAAAARFLVRAFHPDTRDVNLAVAEALIGIGAASLEPIESAFGNSANPSLRAVLAVAHYFAAGAPELAASRPASSILNEARFGSNLAREVASLTARFSAAENPLLSWFKHHPDPVVRKALAPVDLDPSLVRSRQALKSFYLEKSSDPEPEVSTSHLRVASDFLPDDQVEALFARMLTSRQELAAVREAALEEAVSHGIVAPTLAVLRDGHDPLRAEAVELCADRADAELVNAVLAILGEPESSEAKRAAIRVTAEIWHRPEARAPLLDMLRGGDRLWLEAARGLAALEVTEAAEPFVAMVDSGRKVDPGEAGALYFAFTGIPSRLSGGGIGSYRFEPLDLEDRPAGGEILVILEEKSDYRGWIKVEERWEGTRAFRLDEGVGELVLYDREAYDRVVAGAGVLLLEDTVRQTPIDPLELSETRAQRVTVLDSFPAFPFAGLEGEALRLVHDGKWVTLPLGTDLRQESGQGGWGRSALVPLRLLERERVRWAPDPPPSGWLRGDAQPKP